MNPRQLLQNDRWIPYSFVLFFLVIFAVNGTFFYLASQSWTGLVTDNPFERGLTYEEVQKAQQAQDALGWSHDITYTALGTDGETWKGRIDVTIADNNGTIIHNARVDALIERPGRFSQAFKLPMQRLADGTYTATFDMTVAGRWSATAIASTSIDNKVIGYRAVTEFLAEGQ